MTGVFIRGGNFGHGDGSERTACKDGGRDWSVVYEPRDGQDCWQPPAAKREARNVLP